MSVSTKDTVNSLPYRIRGSSLRNQFRRSEPGLARALEQSTETMVVGLPALEHAIEQTGTLCDQGVSSNERIELMAVHGEKGLAFVYPLIALTDRKTEKIMGDSGQ